MPKKLFEKGNKGRPAGTPNKITKTLKEAILEAFGELGGCAWLVQTAQEKPEAFLTLVGKVLPMTVEAKTESTLTIVVETGVRRAGDAETRLPSEIMGVMDE